MTRKGITLAVMLLFIGMSIVPSTGIIVEDARPCDCNSEALDSSEKITDREHIAYVIDDYQGGIGLFIWYLEGGGGGLICDLTDLINFPDGITCMDDKIIIVDPVGDLYEIDPNTCNVIFLSSTGIDELVDIEYDPKANTMWGISTNNFYEINMTTYEATLIGSMGNPSLMISLGGDTNGNVWALELNLSGAPFYKINTSTGEAILIGNTGVCAYYDQDMAYDNYDDIIYWCAFNYATFCGELWTINVTNAFATFIGTLQGCEPITLITIPYDWPNQPPEALNITGPHYGRPGVNYTFCVEGVDPEGDDLFCMWDWGDGNFSDWLGPYGSGEMMCASHAWSEEGTYTIRVKLKDIYGNESDWLSHVIIIEAGVPYVEITKPKRALYIRDKKIIPFIVPVIIGDIQIWFWAEDSESGLNHTELYIDDELKEIFTVCPKSWLWNETTPLKFRHRLELVAYDNAGNNATKKMTVWKFF